MEQLTKSGLVGVCLFIGIGVISLATQQDEMVAYRMEHAAKRAVLGKYRADRMYQEEMRRKSIESFKNNPNREEFLKKHPGFLDANPEFR